MKKFSVLFLGQKTIGERCFAQLLAASSKSFRIAGVVTNTSDEAWWGTCGIAEKAKESNIPVISNATRAQEEIFSLIEKEEVDLLLSVQHPWIIEKKALLSVGGLAFNLHNAPLPKYKGYNAANHALLNGEKSFCSTLHWMSPEVDAGEIAFVEEYPIEPQDHAVSLYKKGIAAAEKAFSKLLEALAEGKEIPRIPMSGEERFFSRKSIEGLREVTNPNDEEEINRKARAFFFPPFEPAFIKTGNSKIYLFPEQFEDSLSGYHENP